MPPRQGGGTEMNTPSTQSGGEDAVDGGEPTRRRDTAKGDRGKHESTTRCGGGGVRAGSS